MEGDEMEMTREELQKWIRGQVKKNELILGMLEKCSLLQSLLDRREKQATDLLKLCESVAACEAVVKKQYSLLGWEYTETHSDDDDDDDDDDDGNAHPSSQQFGRTETRIPRSPATNGPTPLLPKLGDREKLCRDKGRKTLISLKRKPVVVLTRLSPSQIKSLRPPMPHSHVSEEESSDNSGSDMQWEPDDASSDSDHSFSSFNSGSNKRRKIDQKNEEVDESSAKPQASPNTGAKTKIAKNTGSKGNTAKTSTPQANKNTKATSNTGKTSTSTAKTNGGTSVSTIISHCESSNEATQTEAPPSTTKGQIVVNMNVLAKSRSIGWQQGKILDIVRKEDGRLKYKVNFESKGKSLVSGHHIAFDCMAKLEQLSVGARVVVNCKGEKPQFCAGIVAEVPCRKNRMRFLVFMDDHTPIYVGLPLLHLVCKPLPDPLDDIVDEGHKNFMKEYIKAWPYPPQTQYKVGQTINAELDGVQQRCEVEVVDCSLIQVIFQKDLRKDWIYRGSMRLEHMINMREHLDSKKDEGQRNKYTAVNESSTH